MVYFWSLEGAGVGDALLHRCNLPVRLFVTRLFGIVVSFHDAGRLLRPDSTEVLSKRVPALSACAQAEEEGRVGSSPWAAHRPDKGCWGTLDLTQ